MSTAPVIDLATVRARRLGTEPWLSKRQLAAHLGYSVRWIEYRLAEGMPGERIGGRWRFQRSVVEGWLREREGA